MSHMLQENVYCELLLISSSLLPQKCWVYIKHQGISYPSKYSNVTHATDKLPKLWKKCDINILTQSRLSIGYQVTQWAWQISPFHGLLLIDYLSDLKQKCTRPNASFLPLCNIHSKHFHSKNILWAILKNTDKYAFSFIQNDHFKTVLPKWKLIIFHKILQHLIS
jgi:hypothetical protein